MRTGGHTHAEFKGDHQAEYAWFALSDSLPVLSASAESVARKFLDAVCDGEAEVRVGWQTHLAVLFHSLFSQRDGRVARAGRPLLPASDGRPTASVRGEDLAGAAPDLLTRPSPPAPGRGRRDGTGDGSGEDERAATSGVPDQPFVLCRPV